MTASRDASEALPITSRLRLALGFSLAPALGAATPLIALPAIATTHGATGWAAIAIGTSVGAAAAVFVELAWGLTGPQLVARTPVQERPRLYLLALATKVLVLGGLLLPTAAIALILAHSYPLTVVLAAAGTAAAATSPNWYFTGVGRPQAILLADSLPRLVMTVATSLALLAGAPLWVSPAGTLAVSAVVARLGWVFAGRGQAAPAGLGRIDVLAALRQQRMGLGARGLSALYIAIPTALVSTVQPAAVPAFAAAERLMRMGLAVLVGIPNSLQHWLGSARDLPTTLARVQRAVWVNVAVGVLSGAIFALCGPWLADVFFRGEVPVAPGLALVAGGIVLLTSTTRATGGLGLVKLGRVGWITASAGAGCLVGLPLIAFLATRRGAEGAMVGMAAGETAVLLVQAIGLAIALRRTAGQAAPDEHD